jgi:hypothetical protein
VSSDREPAVAYVGAACDACGAWRYRGPNVGAALDPVCPHCGVDCTELSARRSDWHSKAMTRMWAGESLSKIVRETARQSLPIADRG